MKVAVVGLGSMGSRHVRNLRALGHQVRGSDPREGRLDDLDLQLVDGDEDAIVIATPADSHRLQGCPRPHLVEKPLSDSAISARSAFRCDEGHVPLIQVGYNWRFDPQIAHFRRRVREQLDGRVLSARVEFGCSLGLWRDDVAPEASPYARTGVLLEASHEIDLIRWIFGEPRVVGAWIGRRRWKIEAEDTALAILEVHDIPIELHLDMTKPFYWRSISVDTEERYFGWDVHDDVIARAEATYLEEMRAFCRWVEIGEHDERAATFDDGIRALEIIDEIRKKAA